MGRRERAISSRAKLVGAARSCFAAHGYELATVAGILDQAGMARGALYHYFPAGKRDIFQAVFDQLNDEYHQERDGSAIDSSPTARIISGMRAFLRCSTRHDFAQIVLTDAPRLIPSQSKPGSSYRMMVSELDNAVAAGEINSVDTAALAMILHGATRSAGEYVIGSDDREQALISAGDCLERLVAGYVASASAPITR
jgi:AcrR family transcriptional regulator